jgi:hypothetical protein
MSRLKKIKPNVKNKKPKTKPCGTNMFFPVHPWIPIRYMSCPPVLLFYFFVLLFLFFFCVSLTTSPWSSKCHHQPDSYLDLFFGRFAQSSLTLTRAESSASQLPPRRGTCSGPALFVSQASCVHVRPVSGAFNPPIHPGDNQVESIHGYAGMHSQGESVGQKTKKREENKSRTVVRTV